MYIDLNMVRAGVVSHPAQWKVCGYNEIHSPTIRYRIIDQRALVELGGFNDMEAFRHQHQSWVEEQLRDGTCWRDPKWTESVAVGPASFTEQRQARTKL